MEVLKNYFILLFLNNFFKRLHTYVRFVPLEGFDKHTLQISKNYKEVVKESVTLGLRPEKYSTGNSVKSRGERTIEQEDFLKNPPIITELGKKIFGIEDY